MRKRLSPEIKTKIALEAMKEQLSWSQLSSKFKVNNQRINTLKKAAELHVMKGFSEKSDRDLNQMREQNEELLKLLGEARLEMAWLKKNLSWLTSDLKRALIEIDSEVSISRQCELLGLSRSSFYYSPIHIAEEEIQVLNQVDEIYTKHPFFGSRRISDNLKELGFNVGRDRVRSLMRHLGLECIFPKQNTSRPNPDHKVFPYLLRGKRINRPNQVWAADNTYVRLAEGFGYLFAIMDWYSRFVISWRLSPSLTVDFCVEALMEALSIGQPEYFNVDQGSQFTSPQFYEPILNNNISYSMDGRGRYLDNIFVERLWRTLKYENIFISDYTGILDGREGLSQYFDFYNLFRNHSSLEKRTPFFVFTDH